MTTFNKSLAGSITGSGTVARQANKAVAGLMPSFGLESPLVPGGGKQLIESGGITLAVGGLRRG